MYLDNCVTHHPGRSGAQNLKNVSTTRGQGIVALVRVQPRVGRKIPIDRGRAVRMLQMPEPMKRSVLRDRSLVLEKLYKEFEERIPN